MATLVTPGRQVVLPTRCLVGRSRDCDLVVRDRDVSAHHAELEWNGADWQLRDLGSRNGTWLAGERVEAGAEPVVPVGARLAFGREGEPWVLHDAAPPQLMARRVSDEAVCLAEGGYLVLPTPEAPEHCIHREPGGTWVGEHEGSVRTLEDREILTLRDGTPWRVHLPTADAATWQGDPAALEVGRLRLRLSFSRDEEHVEALVLHDQRSFELKARAHHYLLLVLARRRLADQAAGVPEREQGFIRQDELSAMLRMTDNHLYITIHRARAQLGELGVLDAAALIERRAGTRLVRIGIAQLELVPLPT